MSPLLLATPQALPSDQLDDWGVVKEALSEPAATVRGRSFAASPTGSSIGTWECTPGRWRRQVMQAEFAHIVAGHAWFHPDRGRPIELRTGDAVFFPPNTTGTWTITETLRKTYVIIEMPKLRTQLLGAMPRPIRTTLRATRAIAMAMLASRRAIARRLPAGRISGAAGLQP